MTSKKTDSLTAASALDGTELVHVVQSSNSRKTTTQDIADLGTSQDNMTDGTTNKNYTATEQTKLAGIEAGADVTDSGNVGSAIHGAPAKPTPVDADELSIVDSEASNVLKKVTYANLRSTIFSPGQIPFPATANPSSDPNTLDDYEEGSTTPTVTASSGTFTSVSCALSYIKICRAVLITCRVTITTSGTATGQVLVPLPFTSASVGSANGVEGQATGLSIVAFITSGSTTANIVKYDGGTIIGSGRTLYFSGQYFI